jgi:hypothetical protein
LQRRVRANPAQQLRGRVGGQAGRGAAGDELGEQRVQPVHRLGSGPDQVVAVFYECPQRGCGLIDAHGLQLWGGHRDGSDRDGVDHRRGPGRLVRIDADHDPIHHSHADLLVSGNGHRDEEGTPTFGSAGLSSATTRHGYDSGRGAGRKSYRQDLWMKIFRRLRIVGFRRVVRPDCR